MKKILIISIFMVFSCSKRHSLETVNYSLSGTILNCDDEPIANATVSFDEYEKEVTTNSVGAWSLEVNNVLTCEICSLSVQYKKTNETKAKATIKLKFINTDLNNFIYSNKKMGLDQDHAVKNFCNEEIFGGEEPAVIE